MHAQKSILLVTVDCLCADHVGFMGYNRPTTPFLDLLAAESFVIPNAVVAGVPTYYSLPAILASRLPLALGRDIIGLGPSEPTLASILKDSGYATAAFGAGNPYLSTRFGYEQGFDTFRDFLQQAHAIDLGTEKPIPSRQGWARRINGWLQAARPSMGPLGKLYDELYFEYCQRVTPLPESLDALRRFPTADVIVDHARDWLSSIGDSPFFLWLHLMDPHSPYYPKDAAVSMLRESPVTPRRARYLNSFWNRSDIGPRRLQRHREEIVGLYDAGIRWVDEQMKRLTESLRKFNRWDDCILALTADHGEEFLEHGGRYHPPSQLHEELIHVPLLLRLPASRKLDQHPSPFSLMNLGPTLLEAAGLPVQSYLQGRSYLGQMRRGEPFDTAVISECVAGCTNPFHPEGRMGSRILAVREAGYKLVIYFDPAAEKFYDLEEDPSEQSPLSEVPKPVQRRLLEAARDHLRRSRECDERMRVRARLREVQLEWARSLI